MPLDTSRCTTAVLTRLNAVWSTGDGGAPDAAGNCYAVLDVIPGGGSDGSMGDPESDTIIAYRLTVVSRDVTGPSSTSGGRAQVEHVWWRLHTSLMDRSVPITGTGWNVAGREHVAYGGIMREGSVWNLTADYALWVAATA